MSRPASALRRIGFVLLLVALVAVWSPQAASAHAFLTSSSPADGAALAAPPAQLRLDFSETVVLAATQIDLVGEGGQHYPVTNLRIQGEGGEEPSQLLGSLPSLPRGAYRLSWQTLSADDLHRTAGVLVFGVGQEVAAAGLDEPTPAAAEAALRWLVFLALALSLGGALMRRLVSRRGGTSSPGWVRLTHRGELIGPTAGLVGAAVLLIYQIGGGGFAQLLGGSYGVRWGLRELGFLLLLVAALLRPSRVRATGIVVGAGLVGVGSALLGHSGAGQTLSLTRVAADALHVVSAGTWAGALFFGLLFVVPAARGTRERLPDALAVMRAFGLPAAAFISAVIVTGVYLTSSVVGSVDAALVTFYGRTLLLKVAVVAVIGVLGLLNHARVRRTTGRAWRSRTVVVEAALALLVLGLSAVITSGQPALEPQLVQDPQAKVVPIQDSRVADLQQAFAVRPNLPGQNLVLVDVFDTRRPAPAPIRGVTVGVLDADGTSSAAVAAQRLADGRWSAPVVLNSSGAARIVVTVHRPGLSDATHTYRWAVAGGPAATRSTLVSTKPIKNQLLVLWLAVTSLTGAGWWVAGLSRRSRGRMLGGRTRTSARGVPAHRDTTKSAGAERFDEEDDGTVTGTSRVAAARGTNAPRDQ
ncbi:MAG: copper transport protein [Kribbellaceae bacterium]|nr:copper transport protein [Kribbellaceae bacterium]